MNRVIWKYELEITDVQTIRMPYSADVLSVANQNGALCLWALVDPENDLVERKFQIIGTGNPISNSLGRFVGTVVIDPFVWHVFEE